MVITVMLDQAAAAVKSPGADNVLFDLARRSFWSAGRRPRARRRTSRTGLEPPACERLHRWRGGVNWTAASAAIVDRSEGQ